MRSRILAAAALAAAAVTTGSGAAQAGCVGSQQLFLVCATVNQGALPTVDPYGSSWSDCIHYGLGKPCIPITVPIPTVTPGSGELVTIGCGGSAAPNC